MTFRRARNNITVLKLFTFLDALYPMSILAVVWFYQITGSYTLAALMFSIQIISQGIFEIPTGVISDKIGRVKNIRFSAGLWLFSYLLIAISGNLGGTGLLIVAAIIGGLAGSLSSGTKEALIYESLSDDNKQSEFDIAYSRIEMMGQIGAMVGAGIAAAVMFFANLTMLAWITVFVGGFFFASSFLLTEPKTAPKSKDSSVKHFLVALRKIWRDKKLRALVGIQMLNGSGPYNIEGAYFSILIPPALVPIARLFRQFTGVIGFYIAPLIRKLGFLKILMLSNIGSMLFKLFGVGINCAATPFVNSSTNLFYGLDMTATNSLLQQEFSDRQRSTMKSIQSLLSSISTGIIFFALGVIADLSSLRMAVTATLILDLMVIIAYWRLFKKYK